MTVMERTAYPRFKRILSAKDLAEVYTPTPQERFLAHRSTKGSLAEFGFLVLLKTYQRLGRFIPISEVPFSIRDHIAKIVDSSLYASDLNTYDTSGTRQRHIPLIRAAQQLKPYDSDARTCMLNAMVQVARTKEDLADLINVGLDELARERFELPPFATLDKAAHHVRAITMRDSIVVCIRRFLKRLKRLLRPSLLLSQVNNSLLGNTSNKNPPAQR